MCVCVCVCSSEWVFVCLCLIVCVSCVSLLCVSRFLLCIALANSRGARTRAQSLSLHNALRRPLPAAATYIHKHNARRPIYIMCAQVCLPEEVNLCEMTGVS